MMHALRSYLSLALGLFVVSLWGADAAFAQDFEEVGGPYEVDENTVVLMHFDGTIENAASTENGGFTEIAEPNGVGNLEEVTEEDFTTLMDLNDRDMGQQLHINNESSDDSTFITIPDTAALDLTGSWTMEAWVFIRDYSQPHLQGPRLFFKPGSGEFAAWQSNYYFNIFGGPEAFRTGYWENTNSSDHIQIQSPDGSVQSNKWLHLTFIRDSTKNVLVQMIHEGVDTDGDQLPDEVELQHFATLGYDPIEEAPPQDNDSPLYIGNSPQDNSKRLWAYMDELRISNTVRNFPAPPIMSNVQLPDQPDPSDSTPPHEQEYEIQPNESYEVRADISTIGALEPDYARLQYRTGGSGDFTAVEMEEVDAEEGTYAASIPGQPLNTTVEYFIESEVDSDNPDNEFRTRLPNADSLYYNYAVVPDSSQTLYLSFETDENGEVVNEGESAGQFEVQSIGDPQFADEGAPVDGGSRSIELDGVDDHLAVMPPGAGFMNSKNFVIDFWFRADSLLDSQSRWVIKEGLLADNDFNYQVWSSGGGDVTPALYAPGGSNNRTGDLTGFDSTFAPNEWYRVVYATEGDTTYARLYNDANELIDEQGGDLSAGSAVHLGRGPLRIGARSDYLGTTAMYDGVMDEIKFFNYVPESYKEAETIGTDDPGSGVAQLTLRPNRPNPFQQETVIEYGLSETGHASLAVYDLLGRKVQTLEEGVVPAGTHTIRLQADDLPSGVYFYRLETEEAVKTQKMVVLK